MTGTEIIGSIAILLTLINLVSTLMEKVWGGGRASAATQTKLQADIHRIELDFTNRMVAMREEMNSRIDTGIENTKVGIAAIIANQHALEKSVLEFRNIIAEAGYVRRPEFTDELREIKKNLDAGFRAIENRITQIIAKDKQQ